MRFAVGYQLPDEDEEPLVGIVEDFADRIAEVYFPWLDMPSGRSPMAMRDGFMDWTAQARVESDLRVLKSLGVKLDLLLNANCYGGQSLSQALANRVCSVIDHLGETVGLDVVTTTSLALAHTVREHFPGLQTRASVNMRIGTVKGAQYVADLFDSFTIQREYNRDPDRIRELRAWADANGKTLHFLANSGCVSFCSGQTFHDNLVAHEAEIAGTANLAGLNPMACWRYFTDRAHWPALLQNSWVRPEDVHRYREWFPVAKLATRMHANPRRVIAAYCEGRHEGNLLDLLEPNHTPLISPYVIDNSRFPADWFERTTACDKRCHACAYCTETLEEVLVDWGR